MKESDRTEEEVGDAENHLKAEGKAISTSSDT